MRIAIAIPMLIYGITKVIYGIDFIKNLLASFGIPSFISYGVYFGELIAPLLILFGFRTRLASVIFAVNCLTIIGLTQTSNIFKLNSSGGWAMELVAMFLLISIGIFFTGGGKIAISTQSRWD